MLSHYYVFAVIVACLIYFPTAFNGVLKRLLRYIFPRIVSVVYKASSCPPGLFPLKMTLKALSHMRPKQQHARHLEQKNKLLILQKNLLSAKLPEVAMATGIVSKNKFASLIIHL